MGRHTKKSDARFFQISAPQKKISAPQLPILHRIKNCGADVLRKGSRRSPPCGLPTLAKEGENYASCIILLKSSSDTSLVLSFTTCFRACISLMSMARST